MENWNDFLSERVFDPDPEPPPKIETIGQLKKAIEHAKYLKKKGAAATAVKGTWIKSLLSFVPGAVAAKSMFDVLKSTYHQPDDKKTQTGLDHLQVDDQVSAVVDDRVENEFLEYLSQAYEKVADDTKLANLDVTKMLNKFLDKQYHGRTINTPKER